MTFNVNFTQHKFVKGNTKKMPNTLINAMIMFLMLSVFNNSLISQNQYFCGQTEAVNNWLSKNPELKQLYEEQQLKQHSLNNYNVERSSRQTNYTIPLVFHVLHVEGVENISDEQIFDQVAILNRDYNKLNSDTALIDVPFKNNIANVGFSFKLASIDPNGNCTNGITRHYDSRALNWDTNNLDDFTYSWPRDQYLNIYVVKKLNINATAYAFLPGVGVPDFADVIVMTHDMCGSIGTGTVANSRVLTHEVAHWFDIQHTWGSSNAPGVACGDDLINDTPITKGFSNCNIANSNVCDATIYENIQNYMDYSPCKIMFTNGQKDRMYSTIASGINGRDNIFTQANLIATGVLGTNTCATKADFYTTKNAGCEGQSFTFKSLSQFGNTTGSHLWDFPGGDISSSTDSIVTITYFDEGVYPVSLTATSANGTDIENRTGFIKIVKPSNIILPFSCDFENALLPESIEVINQQLDSIYWKHLSDYGANNSNGSIFLNNFLDTTNYGNRDYFETPIFDFSNTTNIILSYFYAYAKRYSTQADSFWVQYSTDCGGSWTRLPVIPNTNGMANNSGGTLNTEFFPTELQWKKVTVPAIRLRPLENEPSVKFRFFFKSDYYVNGSNNVFIDDINIEGFVLSTNLIESSKQEFTIYPNPANDIINIEFIPQTNTPIKVTLLNLLGEVVQVTTIPIQERNSTRYSFEISNKLSSGAYFISLKTENNTHMQKIIIL